MTNPIVATTLSFALDFLQVSRPGWWLVTVWLYIAPTAGTAGQAIDWAGLVLVLLPLNVMVYGMNDAADLNNDLENDRKGNFIFGPKGWSRQRLMRVLYPATVLTLLPLLYWGWGEDRLLPYVLWFATGVVVNYLYNFYSFSGGLLLVFVGYGSVTLLSYWRHQETTSSDLMGWRVSDDSQRWYLGGCNQEYWIHLTLLLIRSQLWTELLDYDSDRQSQKSTTLSRLPNKYQAQQVVGMVLLTEIAWCYRQYQLHGPDWLTLFGFACMGFVLFSCLEYALPRWSKAPSSVDLAYLGVMQNVGGLYLLYDCWSRGIFVE